jgi:hypothetical protein
MVGYAQPFFYSWFTSIMAPHKPRHRRAHRGDSPPASVTFRERLAAFLEGCDHPKYANFRGFNRQTCIKM